MEEFTQEELAILERVVIIKLADLRMHIVHHKYADPTLKNEDRQYADQLDKIFRKIQRLRKD